jgi:hypothetical protein
MLDGKPHEVVEMYKAITAAHEHHTEALEPAVTP